MLKTLLSKAEGNFLLLSDFMEMEPGWTHYLSVFAENTGFLFTQQIL